MPSHDWQPGISWPGISSGEHIISRSKINRLISAFLIGQPSILRILTSPGASERLDDFSGRASNTSSDQLFISYDPKSFAENA
jgi:hypothetical protein